MKWTGIDWFLLLISDGLWLLIKDIFDIEISIGKKDHKCQHTDYEKNLLK
ncbi:unnamed protein product [marine sediment metagenome]|uniref:Uncharacterized protein n=1 Tax=marine sediment metagenome TaxID=412755 RepID=X1K7H2_9ZZZZ